MLEHECRCAASRLEDLTSLPLPVSSSCSLLSGTTRRAGINYGKDVDCDTDTGRSNGISRPGTSLAHLDLWCGLSNAGAQPEILDNRTQNTRCVCVYKYLPAFMTVTVLFLSAEPMLTDQAIRYLLKFMKKA